MVDSFPLTANGKLDRNALPDVHADIDANGAPAPAATKTAVNGVKSHVPESSHGVEHSMTEHVRDVIGASVCTYLHAISSLTTAFYLLIETLKGRRPPPHSSFASIGVDSLGAILFIRQLSESLGGVRIQPASVFSQGVTISSFSESLYARLLVERPDVIRKLGIEEGGSAGIARGRARGNSASSDLEAGSRDESKEDLNYSLVGGMRVPLESFDDRLLANRDVLEGLRGAFMLFVLWDHFRGAAFMGTVSTTILADTDMFVIISGFTTALQARQGKEEEETAVEEGGQPLLEGKTKKASAPWDWAAFLLSRAVGIFPVLWLALVLNAPRWARHDIWAATFHNTQYSAGEQATCVVLYIAAQQGWVRPLCHNLGPNDTLYASLIWNCFLMYTVLRIVLDWFQRRLRDSNEFEPMGSFLSRAREILLRIGNNNLDGSLCITVVCTWAIFYLIMFFVSIFIYTKVRKLRNFR